MNSISDDVKEESRVSASAVPYGFVPVRRIFGKEFLEKNLLVSRMLVEKDHARVKFKD
jgi:hypothetical protein